MRLRRTKTRSTGRHRLTQNDQPKSFGKKFSYGSRRSDIELNTGRTTERDERAASRKAKQLFRKTGLAILLLAVIISAVNILSLSSKPKVLPLGNSKQYAFLNDSSVYETYASQTLKSSVWNLNKVTVNTSDVSQKLINRFPELSSASLTVPLLSHRPIIYVQPAEPVLVIKARNGAFVVADTGKALLRANTTDELAKYKLTILDDQSGLKLQVGKQALRSDDVQFIQTVIKELNAKQYTVSGLTLPASSSELDVQLTGQPYVIKFNLQSSDTAREQAGTYLAMIDNLKKQNQTPAQYVDVRVSGRAYYQ